MWAKLFSSGWWVAVAGALVTLAVAVGLTLQHGAQWFSSERIEVLPHNGFDLTTHLVPTSDIVSGGMMRDGIQVLDDSVMIDIGEIDQRNSQGRGKFLLPIDRVIGVEINGESRAYPLRFIRWHEIINDTIGGEPLAITYNPLCDSMVVFSRRLDGEVLKFGVSGLLLDSNLLFYDRREDLSHSSLFSQLGARAVSGPAAAAGARLTVLKGDLCTWEQWRATHPGTVVLAPLPELRKLYKRSPYNAYFGSDILHFPVDPLPPDSDLRLKDRVLVITSSGETKTFALKHIADEIGNDQGEFSTEVGGVAIRINFRLEPASALVDADEPIAVRFAFWFAWYATEAGLLD